MMKACWLLRVLQSGLLPESKGVYALGSRKASSSPKCGIMGGEHVVPGRAQAACSRALPAMVRVSLLPEKNWTQDANPRGKGPAWPHSR